MDGEMFESYTEWANDELIWGKGLDNWKHWRNDAYCPEDKQINYNDYEEVPF